MQGSVDVTGSGTCPNCPSLLLSLPPCHSLCVSSSLLPFPPSPSHPPPNPPRRALSLCSFPAHRCSPVSGRCWRAAAARRAWPGSSACGPGSGSIRPVPAARPRRRGFGWAPPPPPAGDSDESHSCIPNHPPARPPARRPARLPVHVWRDRRAPTHVRREPILFPPIQPSRRGEGGVGGRAW